MKIINPATEEIITDVEEDLKEDAIVKYELAKTAQPYWSKTSLNDRIDCIRKFYELLDSEKEELAKTLSMEMGKPL